MADDLPILNLSNPLHKRLLVNHVKGLEGVHRVNISKVRAQRTLSQNAYLHGVVFTLAAKGFCEAWGGDWNMDRAKTVLKDEFLRFPVVNQNTGEVHAWETRSTADLNIEECSRFIEQCIEYCQDKLGVPVPPANEYEQQVA